MKVEYCLTHMMIADILTKPLQGKGFKVYRDLIIGYKFISNLLMVEISTIKKGVGQSNKNEIGETTNFDKNKKTKK